MIKWLTGAHSRPRDWVTDDPLATIAANAPCQVYAVTRVNPIFIEEDGRRKGRCVCSQPGGGGRSGSSGYESQRSSSGWSGEDVEETLDNSPKLLAAPGLSTIPEGRIDYCIPRPVWPRHADRQRKPPVSVDRRHRIRRERDMPPSPYDVLRQLSDTLKHEDARRVPAEEVLRDIGQKIDQSLDALASARDAKCSAAEDALRRLSVSLSRSEAVATVGRALSHSGSSGSDDTEAGRLSLLKRLGRFPPVEPLYDLSGSTSSSSGFSDLTPSPPSSASRVPTRVRHAMLYEPLQTRAQGGYKKLRTERREREDAQWTVSEKEPSATTVADKQICVFPGLRSPDFTLDGHQAEELMRRLKASKRQRFWCRFVTTAVGFFFFLFSVMIVSLMLTRGKRMFGSL